MWKPGTIVYKSKRWNDMHNVPQKKIHKHLKRPTPPVPPRPGPRGNSFLNDGRGSSRRASAEWTLGVPDPVWTLARGGRSVGPGEWQSRPDPQGATRPVPKETRLNTELKRETGSKHGIFGRRGDRGRVVNEGLRGWKPLCDRRFYRTHCCLPRDRGGGSRWTFTFNNRTQL